MTFILPNTRDEYIITNNLHKWCFISLNMSVTASQSLRISLNIFKNFTMNDELNLFMNIYQINQHVDLSFNYHNISNFEALVT